MAICVQADPSGFLYTVTTALSECTGFVVMDATEYTQIPTLASLFAMPESADMAAIWLVGFTLPMTCYLASWGYGVVVNFFNPENERG